MTPLRTPSMNRSSLTSRSWAAVAFLGAVSFSSIRLPAQDGAESDPLVSATVNGTRMAEVFRGMPLTLTTVLVHPDPFVSGAAGLILSAAAPPWPNAVTFSVIDANGVGQTWPWHSVRGAEASVSLVGTGYAELVWWLTPAQTAGLPPGVYTVQTTLNTSAATDPQSWKGVVESVPVEVVIRDEPVSLTEEQTINKFVQLALFSGREGSTLEALEHVQTLLTPHPASIAGLTLKTSILKSMGRVSEALAASREALVQVNAQFPEAQEPPEFLLGLKADLQERPGTLPRLAITRSGQQYVISWTGVAATAYTLERSLDLRNWSDLTTTFEVTESTFRWTSDLTSAPQFFRVRFK